MRLRLVGIAVIALGGIAIVRAQEGVTDLPPVITLIEARSGDVRETVVPHSGYRRMQPVARIQEPKPEPLPPDAQALMTVFDGEAAAIRKKAEQEIQVRRQTLIKALQALQDGYTRDAKLDQAVAIRDTIRKLWIHDLNVRPNPGNLVEYSSKVGEVLYFDVVGHVGSTIWGSEVYTCDSDLATAAVHAGVLRQGQRGIVKVTIVKSPESHQGSVQNGVQSSNWGTFSGSYTVEKGIPTEAPTPARVNP